MKTVILEGVIDRETNELGLLVEGTRLLAFPMVACRGYLIAHDLLEHPNGVESIGSVDDEVEAMGGAWFVRGQFQNIDNKPSRFTSEQQLISSLVNLGRTYVLGVDFKTPVPRTRNTENDCFTEMAKNTVQELRNELSYEEDFDEGRFKDYIKAIPHYMRQGYRKTSNRFGGCGYRVNDLFWEISRVVDVVLKELEYECQRFELTYCLEQCYVTYDECYDVFDDFD